MTAAARQSSRFGRDLRLRASGDFARLKEQGRRVAVGCVVLNWQTKPDSGGPRLGVISSRKLGNAVVRNRARRLLREAFRRTQHQLAMGCDLVLVARNSIVGLPQAGVDRDYQEALRRARLLRDPAAPKAG